MKQKLSIESWVLAGFRALSAEGLQGVKVERIAKNLKVSKGSFYWHFKDAAALRTAMLAHWRDNATEGVIKRVEIGGGTSADKLRCLIELATPSENQEYGGILVEAAIRDWAKYDFEAAKILKQVDQKRLSFLKELFKSAGSKSNQSTVYAHILYAALIGLAHLENNKLADQKEDLASLLELLLNTIERSNGE